jgi:hypothetical protein
MQAVLTISKTTADHCSVVNFVKPIPLETTIFQQDQHVMDAIYENLEINCGVLS